MKNIHRREALKRSAYLLGGTLMAPTIAGVLKGCSPKPELTWTPSFFTEDQARMVTTIADIIMPKTDTPAASELGIPGFVEEMVATVYKPDDRSAFSSKLDALSSEALEKFGDAFNDLDAETQLIFIEDKNTEMNEKMDWSDRPILYHLKELTITGYCKSEVGATQLLQHVMIPTRYDACLPLEETGNGKTWSMR